MCIERSPVLNHCKSLCFNLATVLELQAIDKILSSKGFWDLEKVTHNFDSMLVKLV